MTVSAIIAAAGSASRMNGINKQTALLGGIPVLARSMQLLQSCDEITEIIVSTRKEDFQIFSGYAEQFGITKFVCCAEGGDTRQQSVINALKYTSKETQLIAVHDGARPLADPKMISQCIKDASVFGASVPGVPVKDTLKTVSGDMITDTPDRSHLFIIQTPQIFRKKEYYAGVNFANEHGLDFTDDCQLVEAVGVKVNLTRSDYANIKITTPEDLAIAEAILSAKEGSI